VATGLPAGRYLAGGIRGLTLQPEPPEVTARGRDEDALHVLSALCPFSLCVSFQPIDGPRVASIQPPAYDRIKIDSLVLLVLFAGTGGEWVENTGSTGGRRCSPPSLSC
jgi:hypothetical protein